jgi:hypothetical protein
MIAFALGLMAQTPDSASGASAAASISGSMSIETGRYEPEPNCKKDIDGCFPKVWTASRTFKPGSRVWLRVTLVNRSGQALIEETHPEFPPVRLTVIEKSTGSAARLTRKGCQLRPGICVPDKGAPGFEDLVMSGLGSVWVVAAGKSEGTIVEITREYAPASPGVYQVSADSQAFCLIPMAELADSTPVDTTGLEPAGLIKSGAVDFTVIP